MSDAWEVNVDDMGWEEIINPEAWWSDEDVAHEAVTYTVDQADCETINDWCSTGSVHVLVRRAGVTTAFSVLIEWRPAVGPIFPVLSGPRQVSPRMERKARESTGQPAQE